MITQEQFSDLFIEDEDRPHRVLFNESGVLGFSITREYPLTGLMFQPLRNQKGEVDTVCLINIFIVLSKTNAEGFCPLQIYIYTASRYLLQGGRYRYNYDDLESPSEESLKAWHKSIKPIDLEEPDYSLNINTGKVINKNTGSQIDPKTLLTTTFRTHLKTVKKIRGLSSRFKFKSKNFVSENIIYISKLIYRFNKFVFSRDFIKDKQSFDYIAYELFLKPVPHNIYSISQPKELKIFGTELPVSKKSVIITPFLILICYVIGMLWLPDMRNSIDSFSKNTVVATSILIVWFVLFDNFLPHTLLYISNLIVKFANFLRKLKIRV